jgi:hypothetical protein
MANHEVKPAMSIDNGLTLVATWIVVALTIWLGVSVGPAVDDWTKEHQHLSGWAQFVGGVLAISAAWWVGRMQIQASLTAERERDRQHRLRHLQAAYLAFSNVVADAEIMGKVNVLDERGPNEVVRLCREASSELLQVVPHEVPLMLSSQLSSLRALLLRSAAAIERVGTWTRVEEMEVKSDAALIRRVAFRGQTLSWTALGRTMTPQEVIEEMAGRAQIDEYRRTELDGNVRPGA